MYYFRDIRLPMLYGASLLTLGLATCATPLLFAGGTQSDGPRVARALAPNRTGNAAAGRNVFRFETFGDEGFWTDALRLPQGMMQKKLTPLQAFIEGRRAGGRRCRSRGDATTDGEGVQDRPLA